MHWHVLAPGLLLQAQHAAAQRQLAAQEAELAEAGLEGSRLAVQRADLERQSVKLNQATQVGLEAACRGDVPMRLKLACKPGGSRQIASAIVELLAQEGASLQANPRLLPAAGLTSPQALEQQLLDRLAEQTSAEKSAQRTVADTKAVRGVLRAKEAALEEAQAALGRTQAEHDAAQVGGYNDTWRRLQPY